MSQWCDKCVYKGTDFKEWPCFCCDTDIRGKKDLVALKSE